MEQVIRWLQDPLHQSISMSVALVVMGLVGYGVIRRWMTKGQDSGGLGSCHAGLGMVVLVLLGLARLWLRYTDSHLLEAHAQIMRTAIAGLLIYLGAVALQHRLLLRTTEIDRRHKTRRAVAWIGFFLFFIVAFSIWSGQINDFGIFFGILGAGVALSLQETLLCLAGWLLVIVRKPFDIGDRIEVNGNIGDVIDINVFQTSFLEVGNWVKADQSTGRMLVMPNSTFFRHSLFNYTKGFPFIWNEWSTILTFESDWKKAKGIMLQEAMEEAERIETEVNRCIRDMQRQYAIHYERLQPIVYTSIAPNGVELTLRYLSPVRERRTTSHRIAEGILDAFAQCEGIDFAYPTTRFYRPPHNDRPALPLD